MTFEQAETKLKENLKENRFVHTMGVVATAEKLADIYGVDIEKARMAALLHDCAKYMDDKSRVEYCESHGVEVTEAERLNLPLLHAKCGAIMAGEEYGINDPEILEAIACHTTGKPTMTTLDKIVFVADYIEPGRDQIPHLDELRWQVLTDLDGTVYRILSDTLDYLASRDQVEDPLTRQTHDYYAQ